MQKIISINKPVGCTPLQVIKKFKQKNPDFRNKKISYAGRLDPLAHGVLLLLIGEAINHREAYLALLKEYEFEIAFGIQTDSYDILGCVKEVKIKHPDKNVNSLINTFINNHIGKQLQSYPPFSSRTVRGKPLFWWAKNSKLHEIAIPKKEIEIFEFNCLETGSLSLNELEIKVKNAITCVKGDFRQIEIMRRWEQIFSNKAFLNITLATAKFRISCSSGTYIRELVNQMGKEVGCGAFAIDILRTKVGNYSLKDTLVL